MSKGLLSILPNPPIDKKGWPWREETNPNIYNSSVEYPKLSIVTPSYNQAEFIEETIRSILLQNYPNTELIIIDGGSTDETVDILKKYDQWINYWVSEPDDGQGNALNKGFTRAKGDLVGWQNSDDIYLPEAFFKVANTSFKHRNFDVYYGWIYHYNNERRITNKIYFAPFWFYVMKYKNIIISNQASFFSRSIFEGDLIDESFYFTMDAEFYFRLHKKGYQFKLIPSFLGGFRIHETSKTTVSNDVSKAETMKLRESVGVKVDPNVPWNKQYPLQKLISNLYLFPFKVFYGGFTYYLGQKLFRRNKKEYY